ncbi:hypothetical protein [Anaerosporobacter sp.]|uniref:hypothetical protein n=1 Tax=Anaerosporobacter sp. TaxID=1872529 RepID=UPI00286F1A53|nr:hypothetical protein [Anaerosporobacter sp.]
MNNENWIEKNIYIKIDDAKKKMGKALIKLLIPLPFLLYLCAGEEGKLDMGEPIVKFLIGLFLGTVIIAILAVFSMRKAVCKKKIVEAMDGLGTIEDLENDMYNAKCVEQRNRVIYIGTKYVLMFPLSRFLSKRLQIIKYDDAKSIKVVDSRDWNIRKGEEAIKIHIYAVGGKEIAAIDFADKDAAIEIVGELERRLSVEKQEHAETEHLPIRDEIADEFNKKDKRKGKKALIIGVTILVVSTATFFVRCALIPTDYKYEETIKAVAYKVWSVGGLHYIYYADTTSAETFKESVDYDEYWDARNGGATIYRERYSSKTTEKSAYLREKNLSAKEARDDLKFKEAGILIFGGIFGSAGVIVGAVYMKQSKRKNQAKIKLPANYRT